MGSTRFIEHFDDFSMTTGDTVALAGDGSHRGFVVGRMDVRVAVCWTVLFGRKLGRGEIKTSSKHCGSFSACRLVLTEKAATFGFGALIW